MSSEPSVIEVTHLVHKYGHTEAVNDLSLRVRRGQCYGFFGRNGAGKTTTIKCLLNLLRPPYRDRSTFSAWTRPRRRSRSFAAAARGAGRGAGGAAGVARGHGRHAAVPAALMAARFVDTQAAAAHARAIVMEIERSLGFEPTDREFEQLGYDIESRVPGRANYGSSR